MICDAHIHIGYYPRKGYGRPFYYSPRRIVGILDRCGVGEFIVSSTCAQMEEISIADIVRETREMKRLAGNRAHVFFWLSGHLYDENSAPPLYDLYTFNLIPGDHVLLTTDGLLDYASQDIHDAEAVIARTILHVPNPALACLELILAANRGGGGDNIGVGLIYVDQPT